MTQNNNQTLITVGITCFNAGDTIERAINSALLQSWNNLEIIIADDCSSDKSVIVIEDLIKNHPNARLIKHEINVGPAGARQTIIDNTNGEFLAFFDDDDQALPNRCSAQYEHIVAYENKSGQNLIACYASGKRVYPNGYELMLNAIGSRPVIPSGSAVADLILFYGKKPDLFYGSGTPSCSLMARKTTFDAVGGFDLNFRRVEDLDLAVRLSLAGAHFIGCREQLFIQYATQGSDKAPKKNMEAEIQLAEKHKDYLVSVGRYQYARRWPMVRYYHFAGKHLKMFQTLMGLFIRSPIKTIGQFSYTAPRRFIHEFKMKRNKAP